MSARFAETVKVFVIVLGLGVEWLVRGVINFVFNCVPLRGILDAIYAKSRLLRQVFSKGLQGPPNDGYLNSSIQELAECLGYGIEEYFTDTVDGFRLVLHRVIPKKSPVDQSQVIRETGDSLGVHVAPSIESVSTGDQPSDTPSRGLRATDSSADVNIMTSFCCGDRPPCSSTESIAIVPKVQKPVVFLMHGLLMNSEAWLISRETSLAAALVENGYDVWLGNNRGNKYSWMHKCLKRNEDRYWDYSIDEMARYDIPQMIQHILRMTRRKTLRYIGFSNGTAQMFAALSTNRALRSKVECFIAISPACKVVSMNPEASSGFSLFYPLIVTERSFFFSLFGKQGFLTIADYWKAVLSPQMFAAIISTTIFLLFSWTFAAMDEEARLTFFNHLYSTASTKVVHHWFQMLRSGEFQYYNDVAGLGLTGDISVPVYNISNVTCPVYLIRGNGDKLSNTQWLKQRLPLCAEHVVANCSHMDPLIAKGATREIIPLVLNVLATNSFESVSQQLKNSLAAKTVDYFD